MLLCEQRAFPKAAGKWWRGIFRSTPKVLVQAPDRRVTYTADTRSVTNARDQGLADCEKWAKGQCRVIMENFNLVGQ